RHDMRERVGTDVSRAAVTHSVPGVGMIDIDRTLAVFAVAEAHYGTPEVVDVDHEHVREFVASEQVGHRVPRRLEARSRCGECEGGPRLASIARQIGCAARWREGARVNGVALLREWPLLETQPERAVA